MNITKITGCFWRKHKHELCMCWICESDGRSVCFREGGHGKSQLYANQNWDGVKMVGK